MKKVSDRLICTTRNNGGDRLILTGTGPSADYVALSQGVGIHVHTVPRPGDDYLRGTI